MLQSEENAIRKFGSKVMLIRHNVPFVSYATRYGYTLQRINSLVFSIVLRAVWRASAEHNGISDIFSTPCHTISLGQLLLLLTEWFLVKHRKWALILQANILFFSLFSRYHDRICGVENVYMKSKTKKKKKMPYTWESEENGAMHPNGLEQRQSNKRNALISKFNKGDMEYNAEKWFEFKLDKIVMRQWRQEIASFT